MRIVHEPSSRSRRGGSRGANLTAFLDLRFQRAVIEVLLLHHGPQLIIQPPFGTDKLIVLVKDARLRERLDEILAIELSDTELAWQLHDDGTWTRVRNGHGVNAQDELYKRAVARAQRL